MAENTRSDCKSNSMGKEASTKKFGGMPPKKTVPEIMKANEPRARGAAPNSVAK